MATRSNIAYRTADGRILSIYAHWDGYPAHNGEMLRRYYTDNEKIVELVSLGSISSLAPNVSGSAEHSFNKPEKDVTVAYHRDRGEQLHVSVYDDIPSWIDDMEEYAYLWNGKEWLVNDHGEKDANGFPVFNRVEDVVTAADLKAIGWED